MAKPRQFEPPRRLRPRASRRSRERQGHDPFAAICGQRRAVEVDRCAREGAWDGRPYRDRDPPHVGPIDGKEYIAKRGLPIVRKAGL